MENNLSGGGTKHANALLWKSCLFLFGSLFEANRKDWKFLKQTERGSNLELQADASRLHDNYCKALKNLLF